MNRSLLLVPFLGLLAAAPADDVLTWRVAKGTTLVRSFESGVHVELESISVKVDGQDQDTGPEVEMSLNHDFAYEFSDSIEAVKDGRAARIVRTFTKISGDRNRTLKLPEHDAQEEKIELASELEEKSVAFEREDSTWTAKWADKEEGDEALLTGLEAEVDFRAFLPGKSVSTDDTWEIEPSAFVNFLRPGGRLSRKGKGEDSALNNKHEAMLDESIEGKGTATYRGVRDEDGVKVAVIAVSAELAMHANDQIDGGEAGVVETKLEISYKLEGEILWDAAGGFARSASLSGTVDRSQTDQRTFKTPEGEHKVEQVLSFSGKATYKTGNEPKS